MKTRTTSKTMLIAAVAAAGALGLITPHAF